MTAPPVTVVEFTDPGCPWAFSAEPFRWRLLWLYGDRFDWQVRMVGLAATGEEQVAKGFTPDKLAAAYRRIARDHRMPIDAAPRTRMAGTIPACRAVVAARLHAPAATQAVLRSLRVRTFAGELLDDPSTIDGAALDAGVDPAQLEAWSAGDDVAAALADDMAAARDPAPAARVLDARLASWEGGRRYTCPSYELSRDGEQVAVPGFQPFAVYDVVTANIAPDLERRELPSSAEEVLAWAGTPLATQEVAVVRDIPFADAREELSRVAVERPVGSDGYWSLPD